MEGKVENGKAGKAIILGGLHKKIGKAIVIIYKKTLFWLKMLEFSMEMEYSMGVFKLVYRYTHSVCCLIFPGT